MQCYVMLYHVMRDECVYISGLVVKFIVHQTGNHSLRHATQGHLFTFILHLSQPSPHLTEQSSVLADIDCPAWLNDIGRLLLVFSTD